MLDEVISRLGKKLQIKWQIRINHVRINRTQPVLDLCKPLDFFLNVNSAFVNTNWSSHNKCQIAFMGYFFKQ